MYGISCLCCVEIMANPSAYSPLDGLLDLACRDGVDIRPTLLRVLTDLYVQKPAHTADEETQYVELAVGLIGSVDAGTRAVVAARLSAYPGAPATVLQRLLRLTANSDSSGASSTRASIENNLNLLSKLDCRVKSIAGPAEDRTRLPGNDPGERLPLIPAKHELTDLFFSASADKRRLILTNLDLSAGHQVRVPIPAAADVIRRLESAALQRNAAEFGRILEWGVGIARNLAERIAYDSSGEAIVVIAKAIGMKADVLQRILLFLNPAIGHSVKRVFDLAQLYDDIAPATAARMLTIWREAGVRTRPVHVPQYADDEASNARTRATPARYSGQRPHAAPASPHRASGKVRA
jgi:hypothetical protein